MKRTGQLLKKAREERGLSLHEVALFLKINSRVLQAIEEDDQTQLPARTFLRGFVQSYAKFLKLNPDEVLQVFAEEMGPSPQASLQADIPLESSHYADELTLSESSEPQEQVEATPTNSAKEPVPDLEKSILATTQMPSDRIGFKTIAISVLGLILVVVIYFVNNVVKKYQREAQVAPLETVSESLPNQPKEEPVEEVNADTPDATPTTKADESPEATPPPKKSSPAVLETSHPAEEAKTSTPPTTPTPKADQTKSSSAAIVSTPSPKPAPAPTPTPAPVAAPTPKPTPATQPEEKPDTAKKPVGKPIEVIVEAHEAVEIEYSSSITNPQKLALKADQIHIFKSRSGIKLKINNGGAVNIILNGRDLGVPGASGQPVQVAY